MENSIGIYMHVPFCLSKCPYCDFYSAAGSPDESYTEAVCRAISHSGLNGRVADSIYFGGGTPSLLDAKHLSKILNTVDKTFVLDDPEITLESNPATAGLKELREFRKAGVNRVSFGVQSAVDAELSALGRLHTADDARFSILAAQAAGFENISADLMLGIPRQTMESLKLSMYFLMDLPLSHISAYMLKIEAGTTFAGNGTLSLCPDEDGFAEMYLECVKTLEGRGFFQYEISNFAKKGMESRHNLIYWRCGEYFGIGPSAHSFIGGKRFYIPRDTDAFIKAENPMSLAVSDGEGGGFEEYAMLRLRLCEGLDLSEAGKRFRVDTDKIAKKATALKKQGLLSFKNNVVSLTPEGFLISNAVTADLLF